MRIPVGYAATRLDRVLRRELGLKQGVIEKWARQGKIRIQGDDQVDRALPSTRVSSGQHILLPELDRISKGSVKQFNVEEENMTEMWKTALRDIRKRVLYMDESILAMDKPAGIPVQGGGWKDRVHIDGLLGMLRFGNVETPRLVHRLDKDTSGVLVLARTRVAAVQLAAAFRERRVNKLYAALVCVNEDTRTDPMSGYLSGERVKSNGNLGEIHSLSEKRDAEVTEAYAQTAYTWCEYAKSSPTCVHGKGSIYRIRGIWLQPLTGRKHQLRVHCSSLLHGDERYGGVRFQGCFDQRKLWLHHHLISLPKLKPTDNLVDDAFITIQAPLPKPFEPWMHHPTTPSWSKMSMKKQE